MWTSSLFFGTTTMPMVLVNQYLVLHLSFAYALTLLSLYHATELKHVWQYTGQVSGFSFMLYLS